VASVSAYRWTFLVSGLRHPHFVRIVEQVTDTGAGKIATAAQALSRSFPR
jgi:hypothetical protein